MNFNILGLSHETPKTMMVTLKNDAKTKYSFLEGIYALSPTVGDDDMPKWQIIGGTHEIESYTNEWRVRQDGTHSKIMARGQSNDQMPDDTNYKWHFLNGSSSNSGNSSYWIETASGDVEIRGT